MSTVRSSYRLPFLNAFPVARLTSMLKHGQKMSLPAADADFGFPVLQITRNEYASLVKSAQQYDTLCRNLLNGGVPRETIELLSTQSSSNADEPRAVKHCSPDSANSLRSSGHDASTPSCRSGHARPYGFVPYPNCNSNLSTGDGTKFNASGSASNSSTTSDNDSLGADDGPSGALLAPTSKPTVAPTATRTVQLLHLAEGTTIADVTTVVRGGLLVNIYSRARQNSVALSFLHSSDAHAFYHHVQANGLYIKNSKVPLPTWFGLLYEANSSEI
ncbi:RNA recognition motif containing protein [Metarhizium rileyi]|uniref:RNA recognition motif containing protein n=1 Tax=Metarhizium rileyi (strain RCEF 4871) TaxID=1649241 RepID=A0A167F6W7_METRR|nr:RNA recognition motif containing protein [Metarhizium rileyi RCEF 4871]